MNDMPPDLGIRDREPIHLPGTIQPHGALLAATEPDLTVTHASANLAAFLGIEAAAALGRPLAEVLGPGVGEAALGAHGNEGHPFAPIPVPEPNHLKGAAGPFGICANRTANDRI
jgi:hypothetical protein